MNIKKISIVGGVAAALVFALRMVELFFLYDSSAGFFTDRSLLSWISIAVLVALAVICLISYMGHREFLGLIKEDFRSLPSGILMLASGIATVVCTYYMYVHYRALESSGIREVSATGLSLRFPFLIATGIFGLYLIAASFAFISGKNYLTKAKLLPIISVLWALMFTLYVYVHYSISSIVSENVYAVFSAVLLALYFMNQARFISRVNPDGKDLGKTLVLGVMSSAVVIPYSLSSLIFELCGREYRNMLPAWIHAILFTVGVFIYIFTLSIRFTPVVRTEKYAGGKRFKK